MTKTTTEEQVIESIRAALALESRADEQLLLATEMSAQAKRNVAALMRSLAEFREARAASDVAQAELADSMRQRDASRLAIAMGVEGRA